MFWIEILRLASLAQDDCSVVDPAIRFAAAG
jgi:hypothetical protein